MSGDHDHASSESTASAGGAPTASWGEWLTAAAGGVLVLAALVHMGWFALSHEETPPDLTIDIGSVQRTSSGYLVRFKVANSGTITAEDLVISGELQRDGRTVEESEARLPFLPAHSEREGGLFFSQDPAQHRLVLRPKGYSEP